MEEKQQKPSSRGRVICMVVLVILILALLAAVIALAIMYTNEKKKTGPPPTTDKPSNTERWEKGCVDADPGLTAWNPDNDPELNLVIGVGKKYLLKASLQLKSIHILDGGMLVIEDKGDAGETLFLTVEYLLVEKDGQFLVGSEVCKYEGKLDIFLVGRSDDTDLHSQPIIEKKFIGVQQGGTWEMHGPYKLAWTHLTATLDPAPQGEIIITLADDADTWRPGDRIVIASTDFEMHQAEEFDLVTCSQCEKKQVKIKGPVKYQHWGQESNGVDMRAEVGILTRNIKIHGELQSKCYGDNFCDYYDYDTFGGQTQVLRGFKNVHLEGVELYHMGQQTLGSYPIHFHLDRNVTKAGGYAKPPYAKQLSIHNCFSRCVTVHTTDGVLVEDVVGYDTLGHCFFLEDGVEQFNTYRHNLGLLTKPGMLLPSDRDYFMCKNFTKQVFAGYVPVPMEDCMGVSTYWIDHPNNNFYDNSAAGSAEQGFHFVFHRKASGLSGGFLPDYHGERSPMGKFQNNRAHSNKGFGLLVDRGVKVTAVTQADQKEMQAMEDYAKYMPVENQNPAGERVPAIIEGFLAYKNRDHGAFVRGGDIFIKNSTFADNGVGVTMASSNTLPYQKGAHQEVVSSLFVGETQNLGNNDGWGLWAAGADGKMRSLPRDDKTFPIRAVQIYDGPVKIEDCTFDNFEPSSSRKASALGFFPENPGQQTPANYVKGNTYTNSLSVFFGESGGVFGSYNADGDLTQMFYDKDGKTTGSEESLAIRSDNWLVRKDASCVSKQYGSGVAGDYYLCTGLQYGQAYLDAYTKSLDMTVKRQGANQGLTLTGANKADEDSETTNYQPVLLINETYSFGWNGRAPTNITVTTLNWPNQGWVAARLCYPAATTFVITYDRWYQMTKTVEGTQTLEAGTNIDDVQNSVDGMKYYWDNSNSQLHVKLMARYERTQDPFNYCTDSGCERLHIIATLGPGSAPSSCSSN